ncbi:MAG: hypothetical protein ACRDKU_09955 [Gaiellaceae bacterium]
MRLRLALAVGGIAVAALVVAIAVLTGGNRSEEDSPVLRGEVISTAASLSPRAHLFGERINARLDVLYDAVRIRPQSVRASPRFAPYTIVSRSEKRESLGGIGRVRYDFTLECLTRRCLAPKSGFFTFPQTGVQYTPRAAGERLIASVEWPAVRVASRIGLDDLEGLELQADVRDLPVLSYRSDPSTLTAIGYALAVLLGVGGLVLLAQALALPALVAGALARRRARVSPLRRALTLVQRSTERGERSASRRALERLAVELRQTEEPDLAHTATRLAWRRSDPSTPTVEPLSDEVERVIAEEAR